MHCEVEGSPTPHVEWFVIEGPDTSHNYVPLANRSDFYRVPTPVAPANTANTSRGLSLLQELLEPLPLEVPPGVRFLQLPNDTLLLMSARYADAGVYMCQADNHQLPNSPDDPAPRPTLSGASSRPPEIQQRIRLTVNRMLPSTHFPYPFPIFSSLFYRSFFFFQFTHCLQKYDKPNKPI